MSLRNTIIDTLASPKLLPAREAARTAVRRTRGLGVRARLAATKGRVPGLLSIVVPAYNVERYIGECLESLLRQNYSRVQIIVVDDGSPDDSYRVARRYALRDPRVQIVRRPNGGLSAARNTGIEHARGEFLTFFDSDDFVDRHAYQEAVQALQRSGSDFAVMPYRRELDGEFPPAGPWIQAVHAVERIGTDLQEFPDIMVNAIACSKVFRRDFWDEHGYEFPLGLLYEDQAISMDAYASARSFDVLSRVSFNWRIRTDQSSITQSALSPRNLRSHHVAVHDSLQNLLRHGAVEAHDLRVTQLLNNNFGEFLRGIPDMDDEAWEIFCESLRDMSARMRPEMWRRVDARKKVLIGLGAAGRRELAVRFIESGGWEQDRFDGTVRGDAVEADFPLRDELLQVLDPEMLVFSDLETRLAAVLRGIRVGDDAFEVELFAHIDHLRPDVPDLGVRLVRPDGSRTELHAERFVDVRCCRGFERPYADMSRGAVRVRVPFDIVAASGEYALEVELSCGELSRNDLVTIDRRTVLDPAVAFGDGSRLVAAEGELRGPAALRIEQPVVRIESMQTNRDRTTIELASARQLAEAYLLRRDDRLGLRRSSVPLRPLGSGRWAAELILPSAAAGEHGPYEYLLAVADVEGDELFPFPSSSPAPWTGGRAYAVPQRHRPGERSGRTLVIDLADALLAVGARMTGTGLEMTLREPEGIGAPSAIVCGEGPFAEPLSTSRHGTQTRATFDVRRLPQEFAELAPTAASDRGVHGLTRSGIPLSVYISSELAAALPLDLGSTAGWQLVSRRSARSTAPQSREPWLLRIAASVRDEW